MKALLFIFQALCLMQHSWGQDRPNVLWITMEDISPALFSCYGNQDIQTPTIDQLAAEGIRFTHASSTAPHCSPARSTIITGAYATTYGMDVHRERYITPANIFYPQKLREMGYFCTNQYKTDYNTTTDHKVLWDECGKKASYNSPQRKADQPFFAIFNTHATHMGRIRSVNTKGRPDFSKDGIDPSTLHLPPHVPDRDDVRSDYAFHLQSALWADAWVKSFLDDLKSKGLRDDTIIFWYSDHGGCLPRGKAFPYETGLRVPFVVHVPKKWQAKLGVQGGRVDDRLIGFEDIAPTLLSLLGAEPMPHMQGQIFLGPKATAPKPYQFGFRTNQENYHFDPCRTASDGRFKCIRNYVPHKPFHLRNLYQWGMPANQAWDRAILQENNTKPELFQPYRAKGSEMLFDLESDPYELINLANTPKYQDKLTELRQATAQHIRDSHDLGFFLRPLRQEKDGGLHAWVKTNNFNLEELYRLAETSSMPQEQDWKGFLKALDHPSGDLRYWAAQGLLNSILRGHDLPSSCLRDMEQRSKTERPEVAVILCEALVYAGRHELALPQLIQSFSSNFNLAYSSLETISWYPSAKAALSRHIEAIQDIAASPGPIDRFSVHGKARSLLVNLGAIPYESLYTEEEHEKGTKINLHPRTFFSVHP